MGFWVATTKNGRGSGNVCRPTVTSVSCIAWSSAACVLGGVRLISSASRKFVNTGPGRNSSWCRPDEGSSLMMSVPVMSDGVRSGVNCTRRNSMASVSAAEQAHQHEVDDLGLPDNHPADLVLDPLPGVGEPADGRGVVVRRLAVRFDRRCDSWFGGRHVVS